MKKIPFRKIISIPTFCFIFFISLHLAAQNKQADIAPLSLDSFAAKINRQTNPQIIDVRSPEEFQINHLTGATYINLEDKDYEQRLKKLDKNKPIFVYAIRNTRSAVLAKQLRTNGFSEVYEPQGGIGSWIAAGKPYYSSVQNKISVEAFKQILVSDEWVLVEFGTKYCGACKKVKLIIDSLRQEELGVCKKVNIELYDNPKLVAELKTIEAIPAVILYHKGEVVWRRTGLTFSREDLVIALYAAVNPGK